MPGRVTSPVAGGTNALLRDGAVLVRHAQDVLDAVFGVGGAPVVHRAPGELLEPRLAALLERVGDGDDSVGALAAGSADAAERALIDLTELELRGLVRRELGGRYAVVP